MEKRGLLVIFVLLASVFFVMGACPPGHTGHGVTICGHNYTCGDSDNICPETYGANCTDFVNSCVASDPNCGNTCQALGETPAGNAICSAATPLTPYCCGIAGGATTSCAACCGSSICNTTYAPAVLPGAMYNSPTGDYSCQAQCNGGACNYAAACIPCNSYDGWYNITPLQTQLVDSANPCQSQVQVHQEYRDYTATGSICAYSITGAPRWVDVTGDYANKTIGTDCQARSAACQLDDTCDGYGHCRVNYRPATFVCRASAGFCDVAENCTGSSPDCPADAFAPNTKLCNAATRCSGGIGDNQYNSGGLYSCLGYCDGTSLSCDYANSCNSCVSLNCADSDPANNPLFFGNIILSGGCNAGTGICNNPNTITDSCLLTSTQETTCSGVNQGPSVPYQCNNYDTNNCWCTVSTPNLNQVCQDWGCSSGICAYSGSDWTSNTWACAAAQEGNIQLCPTTGGTQKSYRCYRMNSGTWNWTNSSLPNEAACADGYDNDWDGMWDYDTDNRGGRGASPHGDNTCLVGVLNVPPPEVPPTATTGNVFTANVTATVQANSINAKILETGDECNFNIWVGFKAVFNCMAPAVAGTYHVTFYINTSKSYQSGGNITSNAINVALGSCTGITPAGVCASTPGCEWCTACDSVFGRIANGNPAVDKCVDAGTCASSRICVANQCVAGTCDNSVGCAPTCSVGDIRTLMTCDATCTCQPFWTEDCNAKNCTTNVQCLGEGTPTLSLTGDNYVCAPAACQQSGTTTCATYSCTPATFGTSVNCGGRDYWCVSNGTIPVWNQTNPNTELYCDDGYDNDGDGLIDCADTSECPPDTTPYCCNPARCTDTTTIPADDGIGYGANLFDAPPLGIGNNGVQSCCGNGANEWYWDIGGGACCDQSTDCVNASGACVNSDDPVTEGHQEHCVNHQWYYCNDTVHTPYAKQAGSYFCTYDPSTGGWGWRTSLPPENCTDDWPVGSGIQIDNDNDTFPNCLDTDCMGHCEYGCGGPEGTAFPGTCQDGIDNNCDGKIDAQNGSLCPEGSGNATATPTDRMCNDGVSNEVLPLSDAPDLPLFDLNDDGCCDLCRGGGMQFDINGGARTQCGIPGCSCGTTTFSSWDSGTKPYCCGDNSTNEFVRTNPADSNIVACCNASGKCVDSFGKCQAGLEETEALCIDTIDNDCDGLIDCADTNCTGLVTGTITDDKGQGMQGVIVKSSPPGKSVECERNATTDATGHYSLDALIGTYNIIARKPGYDDNITVVTVLSKQLAPLGNVTNFTLRNGTCHADCTDSYGNCNPACDTLTFTNATGEVDPCNLIPICANRPKDFRATTPSGTNIVEYSCCEGEITRTYPAKKAQIGGDMENVYVYKTVVKLGLQYVTLNIAYWYPCDNC
jgi:hypothetical protein